MEVTSAGLRYIREFRGGEDLVLFMEKLKLADYVLKWGVLSAGKKVLNNEAIIYCRHSRGGQV